MAETEFAPVGSEGVVVPEDAGVQHVTDDASYIKIAPGTQYIDPSGTRKTKPYRIKPGPHASSEYAALPEGVDYIDPEGVSRKTPTYENLDFTTQTLFNMSATDEERKNSLERGYPGKVKTNEQTGEMYVEDEGGVRRRSRGFGDSPGAFLASQAAPVIGAVGGEVLGATAGSAVPGAGTFAGAMGGAAAGGALGQGFNDAVMALAGVYDRGIGKEASEVGSAAAMGGAGAGIGRYAAAAYPMIKAAVFKASPKLVADFLGVDPEGLAQAMELRKKGVVVPISTWAKEAPHLINLSEVLDPAFRTQRPLLESATQHYESSASQILEQIGVKPVGKISEPTAAVSSEEAGDLLLKQARNELQHADARLKDEYENRRTLLERDKNLQGAAHKQQVTALETAQAESTKKAEQVFKRGLSYVKRSADKAMETAQAGHNSGDLWWAVGEKVRGYRAAISARASDMYNLADELAGDIRPDVGNLSETARAFHEEMPENFKAQYPSVVQKISDWAGKMKADGSGWEREPIQPTWAQLHNLRTVMRQNYSRLDLTPDVKHGSFKFFANKVDQIISAEDGDPRLVAAGKQLRASDAFYRENMGPLQDTRIQAIMNGLEAGLPADPKLLYTAVVKEGRTDLTKKIKEIVGKNLWSGVAAADKREMIEQAKTLVPGQIDGRRFAQQVLERDRDGLLELVHGKRTADQLRRKAQNVGLLEGKLDVKIRPSDSITDAIDKADRAATDAKALAEKDPLGTLQREMADLTKEEKAAQQGATQKRTENPLGFLYDLKVGARDAADRILNSEDLTMAAAHTFGRDSPAFQALQKVWMQRLFMGTIDPGERLGKVSEAVQQLLLPGVTLEQTQLLAKEMAFLLSSRHAAQGTGKSIMATTTVEHPWGAHMPIDTGHAKMRKIVGSNALGRAILTKYFKFVTEMSNNLPLMQYIQKAFKSEDPQRIAVAREIIERRLREGGAIGAAYGEVAFQEPLPNKHHIRKAPDGRHYIPDPDRPGKYLRVDQ